MITNIPVNLNQRIKIKLTDTGVELWRHIYKQDHKPDADGYVEIALWSAFMDFGNYIYLGNSKLPFATDFLITYDDKLDPLVHVPPECKGDWVLGTACGKCARCYANVPRLVELLAKRHDEMMRHHADLGVKITECNELKATIEERENTIAECNEAFTKLQAELEAATSARDTAVTAINNMRVNPTPVPMRLHCPACKALHVDAPPFDQHSHTTHACQTCGMCWRPAIVPTVGVQFLPGFKDRAP